MKQASLDTLNAAIGDYYIKVNGLQHALNAARAAIMAYKLCQDEELACRIAVEAAEEKSIRNSGVLTEHLIRHLLLQHGDAAASAVRKPMQE